MQIPAAYKSMLSQFAKAEVSPNLLQSHSHITAALDFAKEVLEDKALASWHANTKTLVNTWLWRIEEQIRLLYENRQNTYENLRVLVGTLNLFNDEILGIPGDHFGDGTLVDFGVTLLKSYDKMTASEKLFVARQIEERKLKWTRKKQQS